MQEYLVYFTWMLRKVGSILRFINAFVCKKTT